MNDPYNFSEKILKDLEELYKTGSVPKKKRLQKSVAFNHILNHTGEIIEFSGRYIKSNGFDEFYERYFIKIREGGI